MLHKFKDFADEDSFEGKKIRIDELLDKDIQVISFKVTPSKHNDDKECTTIQLRVDGVPFVLFTGSEVLKNQLQKYADKLPFEATIKKIKSYYTFT